MFSILKLSWMLIIVVSPITAAPVFDYTSFYLTNPLGIFFQNGQQNPAVWPWVKPCCVIPTTTTVPPTFTTTKGLFRLEVSSSTTTQGTTVSTTTSTTAVPTTTSTIAPIGRSLIGDAVPKENADSIPASGFKLLMNLFPPSSISIV